MLNTVDAISQLLQGSFLEGQPIRQLEIPESNQRAFMLVVEQVNSLNAWYVLRSLLAATGRYPILSEGWGSDDFFSRFYYREEVVGGKLPDTSPTAIIASSPTVDLEAFLAARQASRTGYLEDFIDYSLESSRDRFGACPERSHIEGLINNGTIQSHVELEQWLLNWELQNFGQDAISASDTRYLDWFKPDSPQAPLLLLPTEHSWECLAYLHWFGACSAGTPVVMAFLKKWHQQYAAELVCHYGTMLQLNVGRSPTTLKEAFHLAWEQEALAECTTILPGVCLRDHARSLLAINRWFLHERP